MSWVLAIDFGTTNTVAAIGQGADVRTLTVDGRPVMPSAVLLSVAESGERTWLVGDAAVRFARHKLDWFEACPKRAVPDGALFLGGADVPVVEAVAAVFAPIVEEASRQHGGRPPAAFVITHPATWAGPRVEVLLAAARSATAGLGRWPAPTALTEPEAAAQRVLDLDTVPPSARLVVLDFGGGTVDVTVVDRDGDRLTVVGRPIGLDSLGGEDFDLRLARWMTAEVGVPGLFDELVAAEDPESRERAGDVRSHARAVKEQLSRTPVVPAQLPKSPPRLPLDTPVQVSKPQLEELIRGGEGRPPGLTEAVELVVRALADAPPGPEPAGVFLVGGSSRIPLLGALVTARTGLLPLTHGDPSTAVADGAARHALSATGGGFASKVEARTDSAGPPSRRAAVLLVASLVLVAALVAGAIWWVNENDSVTETGSSGTLTTTSTTDSTTDTTTSTTTGTTTETTTETTTTTPSASVAALPFCTSVPSCGDQMVSTSRSVWSAVRELPCSAQDTDFFDSSFDVATVNCTSGDLSYQVLWRDPAGSSSYPAVDLYATASGDPPGEFAVEGETLGQRVFATWQNSSGATRYSCVREYRDYPVALVITGPDAPPTHTACDDAKFYTGEAMAANFG